MAIQVALEPKKTEFLELIKPEMADLAASSSLGHKIYCRLVKQYPKLQQTGVARPSPANSDTNTGYSTKPRN